MGTALLQIILTALAAVGASSGFWAYMQSRDKKKSNMDKLLMGLAYDRIVTMGMAYIERGWISKDEYEDYRRYFYEPYKAMGGNGVTERIASEVSNLPLRSRALFAAVILNEAKTRGAENDKPNAELDAGVLVE